MITMVTGLFALGTMVSAGLPHACEYADSNLLYIRDKIKEALVAGDLNMTRYHTYKALNGIAKNRANLLDCGCKASLERMDHAHAELKEAARSGTLGESIPLLKKALENTSLGRAHLREFAWEKASPYGMALLYMNTREVPAGQNWLLEIPGAKIKEQVRGSLKAFEASLEEVLEGVECGEARRFVSKIHAESRRNLLDSELSEHQRQYHLHLVALTGAALEKLGDCEN